ncbi:MAG: M42 family metallopeptidase [Peptococcaceae bacterium]|jgi:endoglucanase|nr:M42 family metallopeptidase [Peptococcaceae bacterium]
MLLKELSELDGAAGAEKPVRDALRQFLHLHVDESQVDKLGNLIVLKGQGLPGPKVMLAAHMDEVGLMITDIDSDGMLRFRTVGSIEPRLLVSKPVRIHSAPGTLPGVIGSKAIHVQKAAERGKVFTQEQLYVDIGASSKDDAAKHVKLGDYAYFNTAFAPFGDGYYKGKALDDRAGCAVLAEILRNAYDLPLYGAFTVQEEIGLRGSQVAAYQIQPDFAIVLESTRAADLVPDEGPSWITQIGAGPALSIVDGATIYRPDLLRSVQDLAQRQNIPLQLRRGGQGANDAGRIHVSQTGVPVITLSIPCRYVHSPVSVIAERDYRHCIQLVDALLKNLPLGVQ